MGNILSLFNSEGAGPRTPVPVAEMQAKELVSKSQTITYNVTKDAAGGIIVASLNFAPVMNMIGDRTASYWGLKDNLVYTSDNIDALTETAGSADFTVTDPNNNLENVFETVTGGSNVKRFVAKVTDNANNSLYGWIGGVAASTNAYTFDVYNDRVSETNQNWVGTLANFDVTRGARLEIFAYQSSISFGTGTTLTEEVEIPKEYTRKWENVITDALYVPEAAAQELSNGQWFFDPYRSLIVGRKADGTNSETITYNVRITASEASGGGIPSSWGIVDGRKVVTAAGTAEALVASSTAFNTLTVQAEENNTDDIMVGASTVVEAPDSDRGIRLVPGGSYHFAVAGDLNDIYIDAQSSGDGVVFLYTT